WRRAAPRRRSAGRAGGPPGPSGPPPRAAGPPARAARPGARRPASAPSPRSLGRSASSAGRSPGRRTRPAPGGSAPARRRAAGSWSLAGYLVGSVPVGMLVARRAGIDIRRHGTGNIGASNVLRNVGPAPAAIVALASFAQGLAPAWAAGLLTGSPLAVAAAA